jgi:Helix-turn-helix domain
VRTITYCVRQLGKTDGDRVRIATFPQGRYPPRRRGQDNALGNSYEAVCLSPSDSQYTEVSQNCLSSEPLGKQVPIKEISGRLPAEPTDGLCDCNPRPEPYVDAEVGAAFLCMHAKTLMRLAREGIVPAYSYNDGSRRRWRFLLSELDSWMRSRVNSSAHPVRPRPADERRK